MGDVLRVIAIIIGIAAVGAVLAMAFLYYRLRRLNIPANASFSETLLRTPLSVVLALDLLDLGFDFLSAPISWWLLGRVHLEALRRVTVAEALIPGTQFIPTLTASWVVVRIMHSQPERTIEQ